MFDAAVEWLFEGVVAGPARVESDRKRLELLDQVVLRAHRTGCAVVAALGTRRSPAP